MSKFSSAIFFLFYFYSFLLEFIVFIDGEYFMTSSSNQQSRLSRKDFQLKLALVVLIIIFSWILMEYTSLLYKSYQIGLKKQWFIEENQRLVDNNRDLEKQYEYYKTDYFFRKEAKRKLNKKEPGEKVAVIIGSGENLLQENDWDIRNNILNNWWEYLFGDKRG